MATSLNTVRNISALLIKAEAEFTKARLPCLTD